MQLRAQNQRRGDMVMSAINSGKLGINPNVKHFNWMGRQILKEQRKILHFFHQNINYNLPHPGNHRIPNSRITTCLPLDVSPEDQ